MKENKHIEAPKIISRQLELIEKYYPIDKEKKVVTFTLYYEHAEELLIPNVETKKDLPYIDKSVVEKMGDFISFLPRDYKAKFDFEIIDYDEYKPTDLLNGVNDAIEFNHYSGIKGGKKKWLAAIGMIMVGALILLLMTVGQTNGWYGQEGTTAEAITVEILDIFAWVFIWEAFTMMFLEPSEVTALDAKMKTRISEISFYDENKKTRLVGEKQARILVHFENESFLKKCGNMLMMISGSALIALALGSPVAHIPSYVELVSQGESSKMVVQLFGDIFSSLIYFLAGIGGISYYLGRYRMKRFVGVFALLNLISIVIGFVASASTGNWAMFASSIVSTIFVTMYTVGYVFLFINKKAENDEDLLEF